VAGQFDEGRQAVLEASDGAGGIDDDETGVQLLDGGTQVFQVTGKFEGSVTDGGLRRFLGEGTVEDEARGIAARGFETRQDGVLGGVVGGDEQDVGLLGRGAVGQGCATGDTGSQGEGEEGEATVRGGVQQGEVAERDATGPEPGEGLTGDVREVEEGWGGGDGSGGHGWGPF